MSRKNPFHSIDLSAIESKGATKPGYGMTGAAKQVVRSIEDLAENSKRLMEGEAIVELDPNLVDASFVSDRLSDEGEEYLELKQAIQESGQSSPILVRPSSTDGKRYMVVFGHRRLKVARELGTNVKAVVKNLDDINSVIAQGQENSARSNLSFIERAFFAQNLLSTGMTKEVVRTSLAIDEAMLSKMLGVVEIVPDAVIKALGASKKIGRDRWLSLRQLLLTPALLKVANEFVETSDLKNLPEDKRFDTLHGHLKRYKNKSDGRKPKSSAASGKEWMSDDNSLSLVMSAKAKKVAIELSSAEARPFSDWLSDHMDRLYNEYRQSKPVNNGE
ncbi:plasmid partitioning protein RepB [Agrobacterium pusense]|uniref:plasmid partitioning protein RepB n=1 Tax=Agrobacterium pusense TaxID=648995 RepID=UPI000D368A63|nr:plasmid partitioning protein RepB [Agrobacterium pusense]PTV70268.1 plasmid partitioning protein RepB [Agrobacterium pusense]